MLKKIITNNYSANKDLSLISNRIRDYGLNEDEFDNINKIIYSYYEFPPIIPTNATTDKPLFEIKNKKIEKYLTELNVYNYLTYIKLK